MGRLLKRWLPKLAVSPLFAVNLFFVYGLIAWTVYISFTRSGILPTYDFAGLIQYVRLWETPRWYVALANLFIFSALFIGVCTIMGLILAVLLDQRIRAERAIRTIIRWCCPSSSPARRGSDSSIPTSVWKRWCTTSAFRASGSTGWSIRRWPSIYTVVIAGVWQSSGYAMALFLAGLRSVDDNVLKARRRSTGRDRGAPIRASCCRTCGRCSCRSSSSWRTCRSRASTSSSR